MRLCLGGGDMQTPGALHSVSRNRFNMSKFSNLAWDSIDWVKIRKRVFRTQSRIYKARYNGNKEQVQKLQRLLLGGIDSKLYAVLETTTLIKSPNTPGVNKVLVLDPVKKMELVKSLKLDGKNDPMRKAWISKPEKKEKKTLPIPTIRDRAKQAWAKLALEPEWEAVFEANSYGFRPGRSSIDAIEALFSALHHGIPKWVYKAHIRDCFGEIDHDSLVKKISTFPEMESQLKSWLRVGSIGGFFKSESRLNVKSPLEPQEVANSVKSSLKSFKIGDLASRTEISDSKKKISHSQEISQQVTLFSQRTPQDTILSPLFVNIALHGLEIELKNFVKNLSLTPPPTSNNGRAAKEKAFTFVRYAEDFVILHANKEIIELCIAKTRDFLSTVGIKANPEKSYLKRCTCGFQFLGFEIIQLNVRYAKSSLNVKSPFLKSKISQNLDFVKSREISHSKRNDRYKVKITPSKSSNECLLTKTGEIMRKHRAVSTYQLIRMLRPIIVNWGNYFKYSECSDTFQKNSHLIFQQVRAWVFRRDTRHGRTYIKEKYFPSNKEYFFQGTKHKDNWILFGTASSKYGHKEAYLPHMSWIRSVKHVKVLGDKSPFDGDHMYWTRRMARYNVLPIRVRTLLKLQKGRCTLCGKQLTRMDGIEINHVIPKSKGGKDVYSNLQLIHRTCYLRKSAEERRNSISQ